MPGFLRGSLVEPCVLLLVVFLGFPPAPQAANREQSEATTAAEIREHYTKHEYRIPMRDGVKLFTAVYVPKDTSQSYPFLIDRTPYSVAPYGADHYPKRLGPSPVFVHDGFIFVDQDVRGRFMSEGTFVEVTPAQRHEEVPKDVDESTDTYDTIEWLLHNVPNNNGKAGLWGISYPGFYAAAGMIDSHPALKAASPQAPVTDLYHGRRCLSQRRLHARRQLRLLHLLPAAHRRSTRRPPGNRATTTAPPTATISISRWARSRTSDKLLKQKASYWDDQVDHDTYDAFWKARDISTHLKNVHCAVMTVGGWFDAEDLVGPRRVFHRSPR